jgi:hypothetical protein
LCKLEFLPDTAWKTPDMLSWKESDIKQVLDRAQAALEHAAVSLCLKYEVLSAQTSAFLDFFIDVVSIRLALICHHFSSRIF